MGQHTIKISDDDGKSFKIVLSIGWSGDSEGTWRALDNGFILPSFGKTFHDSNTFPHTFPYNYVPPTFLKHVLLTGSPQSDKWGIRLNDYDGVFGVNEQGMGHIVIPWAIGLKPTRLSWAVID